MESQETCGGCGAAVVRNSEECEYCRRPRFRQLTQDSVQNSHYDHNRNVAVCHSGEYVIDAARWKAMKRYEFGFTDTRTIYGGGDA